MVVIKHDLENLKIIKIVKIKTNGTLNENLDIKTNNRKN